MKTLITLIWSWSLWCECENSQQEGSESNERFLPKLCILKINEHASFHAFTLYHFLNNNFIQSKLKNGHEINKGTQSVIAKISLR